MQSVGRSFGFGLKHYKRLWLWHSDSEIGASKTVAKTKVDE